jgi:hypothetical protein
MADVPSEEVCRDTYTLISTAAAIFPHVFSLSGVAAAGEVRLIAY